MRKMRFLFYGLFLVTGLVGIIAFGLPFYIRRILNIGNITGLSVSLLFFLIPFYGRALVGGIFKGLKGGGGGRILSILFLFLVFSVAALTVFCSVKMIEGAKRKPKPNATAVVLGARVYGKTPSLMLRERLDAAYHYLLENQEALCVVSGGQGAGEDISEAEAMYRYLTEKGIEKERIFKEDRSTNTRENLAFSLKIIKEHGLNENLAIVTNEFHQYRAGKIADRLGLTSGAISGKTAWWLFPTFYVRELYSILYDMIR